MIGNYGPQSLKYPNATAAGPFAGFGGSTPTTAGDKTQGQWVYNTPKVNGQQIFDPRFASLAMPGQYVDKRGQAGGGVVNPGQAAGAQQYGGGGFTPQISTGISVGPVLPQNLVEGEQNRLRGFQAPTPGGAGQDYSPFMQHLQSLVGNAGNASALNFGRDASYANAQQQLGTEQARAGAGTGWGQVMLGQYANQKGQESSQLNALMQLLSQFMG